MSTSVKLTQERGVVPAGEHAGEYYVENLYTEANPSTEPFDNKFFLFKYSDDSYCGVCTARDLIRYPPAPDEDILYYRKDTTTQYFTTLDDAWDYAEVVLELTQSLVNEWEIYKNATDPFEGTDVTVFTSS